MKVQVPTGNRECWNLICIKCIMILKCELWNLKEQSPFKCKHNKLVFNLKCKEGGEPEVIPTPQPKMARIRSTLPNEHSARSGGEAPRSNPGSASPYNSTITICSIQGLKTQIDKQLDDLEEAQLEVGTREYVHKDGWLSKNELQRLGQRT